jgi:hypothetical protein
VATGSGELERSTAPLLAADVGEIGHGDGDGVEVRRLCRLQVLLAAQVCDGLCEMKDRHRLDTGETRLGRRLGGAEHASQPLAAGTLGKRDRPGDRPYAPVERQLADDGMVP